MKTSALLGLTFSRVLPLNEKNFFKIKRVKGREKGGIGEKIIKDNFKKGTKKKENKREKVPAWGGRKTNSNNHYICAHNRYI